MKAVPQDRWILFAHQIIHFGARFASRGAALCVVSVDSVCYSKDKTLA